MSPKSVFKSKSALAGLLTAIAGAISFGSEELNSFLAANAGTILLAVGGLNVLLRIVTKGRVTLFPSSE